MTWPCFYFGAEIENEGCVTFFSDYKNKNKNTAIIYFYAFQKYFLLLTYHKLLMYCLIYNLPQFHSHIV